MKIPESLLLFCGILCTFVIEGLWFDVRYHESKIVSQAIIPYGCSACRTGRGGVMISNQILQNTIDGLKSIARVDFCVMDVDGKEIASTADMGSNVKATGEFVLSPADSQEIQGDQFFKIYDEQQLEYVLMAGGTGEDVYVIGKMAAFQIQNLLVAYKERFDKDNFFKNLLLDNLLLIDIYSRAKKLHIPPDLPRAVIIDRKSVV